MTTAAMAVSMLPLFIIGALGPVLVDTLGLAEGDLGALVAGGFAVAAALSLPAGRVVDRLGWHRCLTGLFLVAAGTLVLFASAPDGWWVAAAVVIAGVPQALANPATNKAIMATVAAADRGSVTGWKQSGVQLGAFVAGLPLAAAAAVVSWRIGVVTLAVLTAGAAFPAAALRHPGGSSRLVGRTARPAGDAPATGRRVLALAAFSVALGAGIASVNTYVALYATIALSFPTAVAGALVAAIGIAGIAGRVGWSRLAGRAADPVSVLPWLALGAAGSGCLLMLAGVAGPAWVWPAVIGVGLFGVAGNAVSMVAVIRGTPPEVTGRASAIVAAGFFSGFAIGPPAAGVLAQHGAYLVMWACVAGAFALAAAVAVAVSHTPPLVGARS